MKTKYIIIPLIVILCLLFVTGCSPSDSNPPSDSGMDESSLYDAETSEAPSSDIETSEAPSSDIETSEAPSSDIETSEAPSSDIETSEAPSSDTETNEALSTSAETSKASASGVKADETRSAESKTKEDSSPVSQTDQTKPSETEPEENPPIDIEYSFIRAYYNLYSPVDSLVEVSDNIYEGIVTNIYFDAVNTVTGEPGAKFDPDDPSLVNLHTIYEVTVTRSYVGKSAEKMYIKITGGMMGYKEIEQYNIMQTSGLWQRWGNKIPVLRSFQMSLNIGDSCLFFTADSLWKDFQNVINPDQFALRTDNTYSSNPELQIFLYSDIIDYFNEHGVLGTDIEQTSDLETNNNQSSGASTEENPSGDIQYGSIYA